VPIPEPVVSLLLQPMAPTATSTVAISARMVPSYQAGTRLS
jgi:hypothetical protein